MVESEKKNICMYIPPDQSGVFGMGKFQIAGGQPVSTCCRKNCVLCMHRPMANLRLLYKVFAYLIFDS